MMCIPNINSLAVYIEASVTILAPALRSSRRSLVPHCAWLLLGDTKEIKWIYNNIF